MNASEARDISDANHMISALKSVMDHVDRYIHKAATGGYREIRDPLVGIRTPITRAMADAVYQSLQDDGFTVIRLLEMDPSSPNSHATVVISW